jgi:hypothetical protein
MALVFMAEKHYHSCLIRSYSCTNAEQTYNFFQQINNPQGQVYCLLYISDLAREESLHEADRALKHVEKLLQKHKFAYAEGRFLLEKAELARALGLSAKVRNYLALLDRHLNNKVQFITPPPLLSAHSRCVMAEHARQINSSEADYLLREARDMYSVLGANYYTTRIDVARWLTSRTSINCSKLITISKKEGYGHEIKQLRNPSLSYYPLHFV